MELGTNPAVCHKKLMFITEIKVGIFRSEVPWSKWLNVLSSRTPKEKLRWCAGRKARASPGGIDWYRYQVRRGVLSFGWGPSPFVLAALKWRVLCSIPSMPDFLSFLVKKSIHLLSQPTLPRQLSIHSRHFSCV